jgi:hypothetical protein
MTAAQGAGSAIRSVCAGEQTRYKILDAGNATGPWPAPWRPPSNTRSMTRATFSRTNLKVRNTTHVTDDQVVKVVIRPLKEWASDFCRNIIKNDEII